MMLKLNMTRLLETGNGYALGDRVHFKFDAGPSATFESIFAWLITDIQRMTSGNERVEVLLETGQGAEYLWINSTDITRRAD